MARINIDIGALGNPATGDTLRTAFTKINNNFAEVYSLVQDGSSGLIATDVTNGDLKLQANGTGSIEIDNLSITGDTITTIATNGSVDLTGNGTGGVNIEALHFNGTSINSADSSRINLNESVTVDGDLVVTGSISGTFTVSSLDADSSTVSNLEVDNFKASAIVIESEGIGSNDNDTTIPTSAAVKDYVDSNSVTASESATFTNKTFDANGTGNSISNIEVADFAAAAIVTEGEGIGSNDNDTTLPTSAAVKDYVDARDIGDLSVTGSTIASPSNADLTLDPSGTGNVKILTDQITLGTGSSAGTEAVAIGKNTNAGNYAQAIGNNAGNSGQGQGAVALGSEAGETDQGNKAVAIGNYAGETTQGANAIAIGEKAGQTSQAANSIVINATGAALNNTTASSMVVKPIRNASGTHQLEYNPTTGEVTYDTLASGGATGDLAITGSTISAPSNADLTLTTSGTGSVSVDGIQIKGTEISSSDSTQVTIKENLYVTGTISGTVDASGLTGTLPALNGSNLTGVAKHAFRTINVAGVDGVVADSASDTLTIIQGNNVTIDVDDTNDRLTFNVNGMGDLTFTGSTISAPSNANLTLNAGGTGSVDIEGIQIKGTEISSSDSTQVTIKENLNVTGTITGDGSGITNVETIAVNDESSDTTCFPLFSTGATSLSSGLSVKTDQSSYKYNASTGTLEAVGFTATGSSTFDGVQITDNKVTSASSNADLELDGSGTGGIIAQSPFTFNAGYIEKINTLTSSSTITVNCATASIHKVTLATNTEFNITNLPTGGTVTLIITQDGSGNRTATFGTDSSTAVKFPGGAPTLSTGGNDIDVVTIINDGTNFLGNCAKDYS